jgi:SPP1 family predicted phage head-tail adaptor
MRAGQLDRRITLRGKSTTKNSFGEDVVTWSDIATVWARWIPKNGTERWASQMIIDSADGGFEIRHRTDLDALDEVVFESNAYRVIGQPTEIGRREGLLIQVARIVGPGTASNG